MIFLSLLLAHLITEFLFKPDELSEWMKKSYKGIIFHLATVFVTYSALLFFLTSKWLVLSAICLILHLIFDYLLEIKKPKLLIERESKIVFPLFITEQALRISVIFAVALRLGLNVFSGNEYFIKILVIINGLFLVTIFANTLTESASKQVAGITNRQYLISSTYKLLGLVERGLLFIILLYNYYFIVPLILIPRVYLQRLKVLTDYRTDLLIGTSFTILVFIIVRSVV